MYVGRRPCKRNKDKDMKLATWNVRSLYRPGALAKLKDELNKYDQIQNPRYCEHNKDSKIGMAWTRG